ncbi:MAG: hypothetical protein ABIZ57_03210 [Candidatus Limnocylindria bacterium]
MPATSAAASTPSVSADPPPLALETVVDGLAAPIGVAAAPDGWLLVNEQAGQVVAIHPESGERRLESLQRLLLGPSLRDPLEH